MEGQLLRQSPMNHRHPNAWTGQTKDGAVLGRRIHEEIDGACPDLRQIAQQRPTLDLRRITQSLFVFVDWQNG